MAYTPPISGALTANFIGSYTPPVSGALTAEMFPANEYSPPVSGELTANFAGSYTPPVSGDLVANFVLSGEYGTAGILVFSGGMSAVKLGVAAGPGAMVLAGSVGQVRTVSLDDAQLRYYFTLTGAPDIEIPISSFQARLRSGASTYLSVVIPGLDYASEITSRASGDLKIDAAFMAGNKEVRQTIIWTHLDTIRIDDGPNRKSITLTGYRQETYTQKSVSMDAPIYTYLSDGKYTLRFAKPNLTLNPGDSVTVGNIAFTVANISYYVKAGSDGKINTQMEISEAA